MNRNEFLKSLRNHLKFLSKEELEKEVLYYINKIDSSSLSDVEVIQSFGKMDKVVKEVCERHGLNFKAINKEKPFKGIRYFYNDLVDLSTTLKNSGSKKRTKILLDLLFLILITCFLKIPFIFIRELGDNVAQTFLNSNLIFLAIWGLAIEIVYVICALTFFVKTFQKWFKSL